MNVLARARAWLRARVIADVRKAWRFASIRIAAAGFVFEAALQLLDLEQLLPPALARGLTLVLFAAVIVGRVAKAKSDG